MMTFPLYMMETEMIKDQLILLCIHPEKGWMRKSTLMGYMVFAAALFDLFLQGRFRINNGYIEATLCETSDPLLTEVLNKLVEKNGKKFSVIMNGLSINANKYYRIQLKHLSLIHKIGIEPVEWLGINWGKRYRVIRADKLKPFIRSLDRVLIYGREPGLRLRLIIELLGMLQVLNSFFPDGELKIRTRHRLKEISRQSFDGSDATPGVILKEFRYLLKMKNLSKG